MPRQEPRASKAGCGLPEGMPGPGLGPGWKVSGWKGAGMGPMRQERWCPLPQLPLMLKFPGGKPEGNQDRGRTSRKLLSKAAVHCILCA